jgi:hypothetical protein
MGDTPTRYPLAWPAGWKRTAAVARQDAKFSRLDKRLTVADGLGRVLAELGRLGVLEDFVIVSTNVETRLDGMPRSGQPEPKDSGVSVYWQKGGPRGGHATRCMAVDRYQRVADNLAAVAATLDAMRAIERHGGAAILDRAFTGFTALPPPIVASMKRDWQVVLELQGLLRPTETDVQKAYRRLAAKHHPDRGGKVGAMSEINAARDEALQEVGR